MLLADMLLREWLKEIGARSIERASLKEIKGFIFSEDAYFIEMNDGRRFQDNDLDRMLSVIRDELRTHNTTVMLKGVGQAMHVVAEYPFVSSKQSMFLRPVVWTAAVPPPDLDLFMDQIEQNITFFNLTGSFQPPPKKDNL